MTYKNILVVLNNHGSNHPALDKSALIARIEKKVRITLFMPVFDFTLEIASLASATERKSMLEKVISSKKEELKSEVSAFMYDPDTVIEYKVTWNRSPETAIFTISSSRTRLRPVWEPESCSLLTTGSFSAPLTFLSCWLRSMSGRSTATSSLP